MKIHQAADDEKLLKNTETYSEPISEHQFVACIQQITRKLEIIARQTIEENEIPDAIQETITRAWEYRNTWKPRKGSFETWTRAILKNVITDILNDKHRQQTTPITSINLCHCCYTQAIYCNCKKNRGR